MLTPKEDDDLLRKSEGHVKDDDKKWMVDAWTGDADGILAFVSLIII